MVPVDIPDVTDRASGPGAAAHEEPVCNATERVTALAKLTLPGAVGSPAATVGVTETASGTVPVFLTTGDADGYSVAAGPPGYTLVGTWLATVLTVS